MANSENVRVEVESGVGILNRPARVLVYIENELVTEVIAKLELQQGADGGWYDCVTLEKKDMNQAKSEEPNKIQMDQGRVFEEVEPGIHLHRRDLEDSHDTNI